MVYNMGTHLYMPMQGALSMSFAKEGKIGRRLGEIQSINTAMLILTAATLYILYRFMNIPFVISFTIGAIAMVLAGILFLFMTPRQSEIRNQRFVIKKKFKLFYVLCLVHGVRKQITFVFVPWLLITVYNQPATTITMLFFIVAVLNVFFRPWLGSIIDRIGERFVLVMEASLMFIACLGFAFSKLIFPESVALIIVSCCYVIDHISSGSGMARTTYVRRLTNDAGEVSATLALGITFDHVLAMSMPTFAGMLWAVNMGAGYVYVFIGGLLIAIVNIFLSNMIRIPKPEV
jgi:MFS family permease